jgi:platelet-activating factor acetylhydrolase IB subunit alpha
MVLTDRQRSDLHAGIYEYLSSRPGDAFQKVAAALREADPSIQTTTNNGNGNGSTTTTATTTTTPLLEKKWTAIPRLQKKVLELERTLAQSAKIHAHRSGTEDATGTTRRMLPRQPCTHKLAGHSQVVTSVAVHPVFTMVASGSEDGTVKVGASVILYIILSCIK